MPGGGSGTSMVARTVAVLRAFDAEHRQLTLTQLAERSGLPIATASRIANELVHEAVLVRLPDRTFRVGRAMWNLGLLTSVETDLREVAAPYLHDIHAATRATVHLAIRDDAEVLYATSLSGLASVPVISRAGSRLPMHCTGVGKVLLAHAPVEIQQRVLTSLTRHTPYTITAPGVLERQLTRIRAEGVATTREEMTLGAASVAVPVWSGSHVVAAVAVVVPNFRTDRARLVAALTVASRGISRSLSGGAGGPRQP